MQDDIEISEETTIDEVEEQLRDYQRRWLMIAEVIEWMTPFAEELGRQAAIRQEARFMSVSLKEPINSKPRQPGAAASYGLGLYFHDRKGVTERGPG